jgi:hypothetical protein
VSGALKKSFSTPDETREIPLGKMDVVTVGDIVVGRATMQPGWRWSEHVKPIVKTESCQVAHRGFVVAGRMTIRMDDGAEVEVAAGDAYNIAPGHDAWVVGDEVFVGYDVSGAETYAKPA